MNDDSDLGITELHDDSPAHGGKVGEEWPRDGFVISDDPAEFRVTVEANFENVVPRSSSPDQRAFVEIVTNETVPEFP